MTGPELVDAVVGPMTRILGYGAVLMLGFSLFRWIGRG